MYYINACYIKHEKQTHLLRRPVRYASSGLNVLEANRETIVQTLERVFDVRQTQAEKLFAEVLQCVRKRELVGRGVRAAAGVIWEENLMEYFYSLGVVISDFVFSFNQITVFRLKEDYELDQSILSALLQVGTTINI